jgi:hypothetical protein
MRTIMVVAMFSFPIAFSHSPQAQEALIPNYYRDGKQVTLHGQGGQSCGAFVEDKKPFNLKTAKYLQGMAWILGYLYAKDQFNPYTVKSYDYDGLSLWIENYCKTHPIELLINAADHFYSYIGGRLTVSDDYTIWRHYPDYHPR